MQCELDVVLDVGFGGLCRVEHAVRRAVGALAPHVANLVVNLTDDLASTLLENPLELRIAIAIHLAARRFMNAHISSAPFLPPCPLPKSQAVMQ